MQKNLKNITSDARIERLAATNGLLDRRQFLDRSLKWGSFAVAGVSASAATAAAPLARAPQQQQPGRPFSNYGAPSAHESEVIRWISANQAAPTNGISWSPIHELEGTLTPNGLHFERHHNGIPDVDPDEHRLVIHGQVRQALSFSIDDLLRYPRESKFNVLECGGNSNAGWRRSPVQTAAGWFHGLVSCSEWTGVPLKILLDEAGIEDGASWVVAEGADAFALTMSLPLKKLRDDGMLALFQNGERLRPEQGYPVRLLVPGWEGVLNVKWLKTLKVTDQPAMARNETARYTELQESGKARMFTFEMGVKSLITAPSYGMQIPADGYYQIHGLAWSGKGRITRVEVSADGGKTWVDAALDEPVRPRCFTRFRLPWAWTGQDAVLQSRATDESGEVQPARAELLAARGRHGYYHYNAIVSWGVDGDGYVSHVYPDAAAVDDDDPFSDDWDF